MRLGINKYALLVFVITGVYLSLNGRVIPNHGYVVIGGIGTAGDGTALLCITNHPADSGTMNNPNSGGDWFGPDGTTVAFDEPNVPGFRRNRGPMVVRLYRDTATDPPAEGIYQCEIMDAAGTTQMLYVGLYSTGGGKYVHLLAIA